MKIIFLSLLFMFLSAPAADAQCSTSTCITLDIIGTAKNITVDNAKALPKMQSISGHDPADETAPIDCSTSPMIKSGAEVFRWFAPGKQGKYQRYNDQFCLSQGCSHQGGLIKGSKCSDEPS